MITGTQIRAARALLGWTSTELAAVAGLSYATIQRAESANGVPRMQAPSMSAIQIGLEQAGVQFIPADSESGEGVRLSKK